MEHRRPGVIGPLILITIGVLFLLANMGLLPLSFWEIAYRFWPTIFILMGLEILFGRRSALGALLVVVLWVALIGGVLWLAYAQGGGFLATAPATTEQLAQPLGDIQSARVNLDIGFSNTTVNSLGSDSGDLMKGTFAHAQGARVVKSYNVVGNEGRLGLKAEGVNFILGGGSVSRWELGLNPAVPIVLNVNGGIGRAMLDLSALNVTALSVDTGIGSLAVTTPKTGSVTMRLNGGVGSATVTIPPGVAARVRVDAGLGGINVDQARFPKSGEIYQSADYASATNKIDIEVDGGVGSINIR
ncbi:MAG: hypothetical protein HY782_00610 [Chloroflexi bacterium]|nr:hypothetical protein [Chloroflexota bacterium]